MALGTLLLAALGGVSLVVMIGLRRARSPEQVGLADFVIVFAALIWGSALGAVLAQRYELGRWETGLVPSDPALLVGSATGALTAAGLCLLRVPPAVLGLRPSPRGWMLRALLALPAFLLFSQLWVILLESLGVAVDEQALLSLMRELQGSPAGALAVLYAVLGAPLCEEIIFRGLGCAAIPRRLGPLVAALGTASVFALLHGADPQAVPPLFVLGLALAWLRLGSGSLLPCLALHVANNALVVLFLAMGPS